MGGELPIKHLVSGKNVAPIRTSESNKKNYLKSKKIFFYVFFLNH